MFIHFGLYSMPARHEWIKSYEMISEEKYDTYFKHFNPDLFDAREWAKAAKRAGMKYYVLIDTFCVLKNKQAFLRIRLLILRYFIVRL